MWQPWAGKASDEGEEDEDEEGEKYGPSEEFEALDVSAMLKRAEDEPGVVANVSINVYYTEEYENYTRDIRGIVRHGAVHCTTVLYSHLTEQRTFQMSEVIYKTNKGFSDSSVHIRVELLCLQKYEGNETWESQGLLYQFKWSKHNIT